MSPRLKLVIGLLGVVLLLAAGAVLFFRYQIRKSFPLVDGTVRVTALRAPVEVVRDEFGVPRIEAASEHDLMVALGYVHAQDRLWQMDLARRAGEGRLSEIFGVRTVPFDRLFRIVGIRTISGEVLGRMEPEPRRRLEWYAEGVNAFIAEARGKLPFEFDALGYEPAPWEPVHSVIVGRLMAWQLALSWWTDLTYGALVDRLGMERVAGIFPAYPAGIRGTGAAEPSSGGTPPRASVETSVMHVARDFAGFLGTPSMLGGSNAWAVAPSRSVSGGTLVANDTHLQVQSPSWWYEVELRAPGWAVGGFTFPGTPGVVSGTNGDIAWGVTNLMADDADFYLLRLDSARGDHYLYGDSWKPLQVREEEITVRDDTARTLLVRSSHHGPLVTDAGTFPKKGVPGFVAAMRWTGAEPADQADAFARIDRAEDWESFLDGVSRFPGPGQNFVYGDREGNIGYAAGALIPRRGDAAPPAFLPQPGWDPAADWQGFIPFRELPRLYNPPEGYIASANNPPADPAAGPYISALWEPPARILRLREVLGGQGSFTVEDFQRLQNDTESAHARETVRHLMHALGGDAGAGPGDATVMEYFRNWDCRFTKEDIATTVYQHFYVRLLRNIYADEMGDSLFNDFCILVNVPLRVTSALLDRDTSAWFDDVRTAAVETRDDILRSSFRQALGDLRATLGEDTRRWRWGDVHTVTLKHPFGLVKPLDRIFNIGPFPAAGASTALMSGEYSFREPFAVAVTSSFRWVVDLSQPGIAWRVLPSGQSGQVLHRHYDDQTPLWLNGAYRTVIRVPPAERPAAWSVLVLEPGGGAR